MENNLEHRTNNQKKSKFAPASGLLLSALALYVAIIPITLNKGTKYVLSEAISIMNNRDIKAREFEEKKEFWYNITKKLSFGYVP